MAVVLQVDDLPLAVGELVGHLAGFPVFVAVSLGDLHLKARGLLRNIGPAIRHPPAGLVGNAAPAEEQAQSDNP